ncbi:hypothetical protein QJQ45_022074 [Haematococcus lacustris]|nr:hypothetical protein QJQ45_020244 [Haematococcus lacustris]KAJ9534570.1 hypothetical protein QJQ45_022074 [Haematococcus lacustris]
MAEQQQEQQADLQQREQHVAEQQHQLQLQQQLNRLQQQLEAQSGAELQRQVQQQLAAQQHLLQQQQAGLLLKQQQVEKQLQEAAYQQAVSTNHPLPDHPPCSPHVPESLRSPLLKRPRQDTTLAPLPRERAWQAAAQTSATRATAQRVHRAAPTVLPTTRNRFATLPVANEQEQQLPSQPARMDEHQAAAAAIAAAAVAAVLRAAAKAEAAGSGAVEEGAELLDRLQQHCRMRSVVSLATGMVPPTPDQVLGGIMVESLRPVLASTKSAPSGQRTTQQQLFNTALAMTMGRGIEQHGIKRTARQLGITPRAVKRAWRNSRLDSSAPPARPPLSQP